jgi:RNA polymerase sigma-70 factor (ECF subfamily)
MDNQQMLSYYNDYQQKLFSQALKLTESEQDAKDLIQDTLFRILKNANDFTVGTNFMAWASTILRNSFINNYRRKRRFQKIVDTEGGFSFERRNVTNEGESILNMKELYNAIEELDETYRIPFLMTYQGYKYEEIAQITGSPLGTVKSRIFIARRRLQQRISA